MLRQKISSRVCQIVGAEKSESGQVYPMYPVPCSRLAVQLLTDPSSIQRCLCLQSTLAYLSSDLFERRHGLMEAWARYLRVPSGTVFI